MKTKAQLLDRLRQLNDDYEKAHTDVFRGQPNRMWTYAAEVMGELPRLIALLEKRKKAELEEPAFIPLGTEVTVLHFGNSYQGEIDGVNLSRYAQTTYTVGVIGAALENVEPHQIVAIRKEAPCEVCSHKVPLGDPYAGFCSPGCAMVRGT